MQTIQEHLDDLDRMVDAGARKPEIRSQIAFIAREVAVLETELASEKESNAEITAELASTKEENTKLRAKKFNRPNPNPDRRF